MKIDIKFLYKETDSSLEEALKRECLEELGTDVYVNNLFFKQKFQDDMEYFYICNIKSGKLGTGNGPEYQDNSFYIGSHKIEKYKISEIKNLNVKPNNIRDSIVDFYKMF
jgi:ADP-ribose pyrophosphatase YjhB (NUDIX family)